MQNVRANVKVMEFQSLCIFSCILTLLIILIKPLPTKAHDRRASGDCGTSSSGLSHREIRSCKAFLDHLFVILYVFVAASKAKRHIGITLSIVCLLVFASAGAKCRIHPRNTCPSVCPSVVPLGQVLFSNVYTWMLVHILMGPITYSRTLN